MCNFNKALISLSWSVSELLLILAPKFHTARPFHLEFRDLSTFTYLCEKTELISGIYLIFIRNIQNYMIRVQKRHRQTDGQTDG